MSASTVTKSINELRNKIESVSIVSFEKENVFDGKGNLEGNDLNQLFGDYKKVVFNSLITTFGLDYLLFKDKYGGNVQTEHNFKEKIYINEEFQERGERKYNRDDYAPANDMHITRTRDFKTNDKIIDGYNPIRELPKDGRTHLEHVVSAKEIHTNDTVRMLNTKEEMKELINNKDNTLYADSSANQSKADKPLVDWMNEKKNGRDETNAERFNIDKEAAITADKKARNSINQETARKEFNHYAKSMTKDALSQGGLMAMRQGLGVVFTEVTFVIFDEIPKIFKEMKNNFSMSKLFEKIGSMIETAFNRVKDKFSDILEAMGKGFLAGVFSSITTTVINIFFSTSKNIVRIIRQSWASFVEALKIIFINPENLPFSERMHAAAKIILTGLSLITGVLLEEAMNKLLQSTGIVSIPIIGGLLLEVIPVFIGTLVSGLLSVSILYLLDNHLTVNKIREWINKNPCNEILKNYQEINHKLDKYISELEKIDFSEFERQLTEIRTLNNLIENEKGRDVTELLYKYLKTNRETLQFSNFQEFDNCMSDENFVLEI